MALSKPHTPGTARGAKLAALLVDEGTPLVRKIFEDEVQKMNPPSLREQLTKYERCLCGQLFKKNGKNHRVNLNPGQRNTLYPASGNVPDTAQGFDISLLELLLKELVWLELGRDAPYSGERDRLRRFRNDNYGHISSTDLSEADFNRLWKELTDILLALGGDEGKISERLNFSIDPDLERKHFELLEKLYKEDMEVKDLLLAQGASLRKGQEEVLDQGSSLLKGQNTLLDQGEGLKAGQDQVLDQVNSLQETLLNQGERQQKGQEEVLDQIKEQETLLAQGESQRKEILDQQQSLKKGQEELKSLLEEARDTRSSETNSGPPEDPSSKTGLADVADDVITCLQDLYATESAQVRPLPWCEDPQLHLEEVFTNLQLQRRDGRGHFQDIGTIVSLSDIYNTRANKHSKVNVRKIRVEGDPGIGKSCSCQKLAYDWSCGKLDRFKVVFFLEMRHLAGKVKDEIFEQLLPKDTKMTPDQLWSYIQQNQDDVLFILDGLDELRQAARQVTDVVDLIQGKILRNCHILVTSRPYHCVKELEKCHPFYRIVGFSKKNSEEFIRNFCESPESASKLVEQLQSNTNLEEIVANPLNNMLICVVWEEKNKQLPSSESELYEMIVHSVAKTYCSRINLPIEGDELPPDIEAALRGLGKLSWEGLEQEQLQFNIAEIKKKYGTNADNMLNMGLLTRDYSFSRIRRTCLCAFLHKTFQEYMAARYISGLFTDGSSGEEGVKCARHLFGISDTTVVNSELIISRHREYRKVQNWLYLILGENSCPLFDMLAEELNKTQTDEDRELLSFLCIMWLGTTCAGGGMAEIVAPCLSDHATNNLGDFVDPYSLFYEIRENLCRPQGNSRLKLRVYHDDHVNWCVGLAHVLAFQKKLSVRHGAGFIQHLTVHCGHVDVAEQEKLAVLESTLSDCDTIRSVTLLEFSTFSPLRTFIPRCGTERVIIRKDYSAISHLSMLSTLEQLSAVSTIEHVEIAGEFSWSVVVASCHRGERDVDFSEYDRMLAHLIQSHSRLRSIRFKIGSWIRSDQKNRGFGNLTATLQSISEHRRLEVVDFELPGNDALHVQILEEETYCDPVPEFKTHETFNVEPMVHKLTECIKKNKILKTLRLTWTNGRFLCKSSTIYHGDCSSESLSSLCSAIQGNQTLETLVVEGMLSHSKRKAKVISELIRTKPTSSNYKELRITMFDGLSVHEQNSIQEKILTEGILEIRTFRVARPENTSVKFVNCLFTGKSLNKETLSTQPSVLFSRRFGDRLSPSSGQF